MKFLILLLSSVGLFAQVATLSSLTETTEYNVSHIHTSQIKSAQGGSVFLILTNTTETVAIYLNAALAGKFPHQSAYMVRENGESIERTGYTDYMVHCMAYDANGQVVAISATIGEFTLRINSEMCEQLSGVKMLPSRSLRITK